MSIPIEAMTLQIQASLRKEDSLSGYLLVDPYLREPLDEHLPMLAEREIVPIPVASASLLEHQRPRLICFDHDDTELIGASVRAACDEQRDPHDEVVCGFTVGGWLISRLPPEIVAVHLARVMISPRPQVGPKYVRWADRRVFEWIWPALNDRQRSDLLGPIAAWHVLDRRTALVERTPPTGFDAHGSRSTFFALDAAQWDRVDRCATVQDLLRGWCVFERELPDDYLNRADAAVADAQSLGLTRGADIVLLGAYVLQIHPALCKHAHVIELVKSALSDRASLSERLGAVGDDMWDAMRLELEHKASREPSVAIVCR
ncbi:DUF4123 domain-containing protein [Burkholderia pseudomultivorans]|uniref:DUF4123 domain-containing protein n=1 Tax=Burkholderia pseudomultivorans TaxID=1207504 RepID=UPI0012D9C07F|nr:DUF4123 domain-containing protein [Burkholderia pseudomultivorans]